MIVTYLSSFVAVIVLIPCVILFIECFSATILKKPELMDIGDIDKYPEKIFVLIPAHNEVEVIENTLSSILPQLPNPNSIIVVADNCNDNTVQIAKNMGVTVLERFDNQQRGKGYALAYGVDYLKTIQPDVVIIIDADCQITQGNILTLAAIAHLSNKPIQIKNILYSSANFSPKDAISNFAFLVKNWVRPLGLRNLNLPCLLTGTGMAFPWQILQNTPLASNNLVEDMQLGIDLAIANYPPQFCPEVEIKSLQPETSQNALQQRTRWEHGHLNTLLHQVPKLLKASWQQKRGDLLMLAGEVSIPPLALLVLLWLGITSIITLMTIFQLINFLPIIILAIAFMLLFSSILLAWGGFARDILPLSTLLTIPFYILWKIPLYFQFLWKPQQEWVRTSREKN